jgi:Putative beta-barrel porin-2, OmpL-like. bbp2
MKLRLVFFFLIISSAIINAQQPDSARQRSFTFSGFADLYYQYDFDNPPDKLRPDYIYNHKRHNQPGVNLALLKAAFKKNNWRANLGLMAGDYVKYNLAAEPDWAKIIYEANVGFAFSNKLSVDAGILPSHLGFESAISRDNWTLSRSLLAESSPYYETGVKMNYTPNEKWTFSILGLNGWQHIKDNNSSLAAGTQIQFKPNEKWLFNSSTFIGNEKPDSAKQLRFFHNFYTSYAISKKINTAIFFDYGVEEKPNADGVNNWLGFLWQLQWKANSRIISGIRYEYYKDKTGVIITPVSSNGFRTSGFSVNADWQITKFLLWRNELKLFHSADKIFMKDNLSKNNNTAFLSSVSIWF